MKRDTETESKTEVDTPFSRVPYSFLRQKTEDRGRGSERGGQRWRVVEKGFREREKGVEEERDRVKP